jgi:hypothetical protein
MLADSKKGWLYPAIAAVIGLGVIVAVLNRFELSIQIEPAEPALPNSSNLPLPQPSASDAIVPPSLEIPETDLDQFLVPPSQIPSDVSPISTIRVSNRSIHPVRVALRSAADAEPVHWDFAPAEGSVNGLTLSLPEQDLNVKPGDILVAFAQDGSRHYWGPYIVGETLKPAWHQDNGEWYLILTAPSD